MTTTAEIESDQAQRPFRCTRHRNPERVLRPDNRTLTQTLVVTDLRGDGVLYWVPVGERTGSGFRYGPGFNAHAADFPAGTRLVVTACIEIPDDQWEEERP